MGISLGTRGRRGLGEECPEWAWALCEHVAAVGEGSPRTLLEALDLVAAGGGVGVVYLRLVLLGEALDLCEPLRPAEEGTAWPAITPLGHAVMMLLGHAEGDGTGDQGGS